MRLPKPPFNHPPEVHHAIIQEHQESAMQMARRLQHLGWSLADAAWAAVHWKNIWLAAAIANARDAQGRNPTGLSAAELERLKAQMSEIKAPASRQKPRKTTRILKTPRIPRTTPKLPARPGKPPPEQPEGKS